MVRNSHMYAVVVTMRMLGIGMRGRESPKRAHFHHTGTFVTLSHAVRYLWVP